MKDFIGRRDWMLATASMTAQPSSKAQSDKLAMPGPFRGRVVAVNHPGSVVQRAYQAEPIREMLRRGMVELTGAGGWPEAWKFFFQPGDVVGIKLNPVGRPHVMSSPETVREIIAGLNAAGIPNKDIVLYDRYKAEFYQAGFDRWAPDGVRFMWGTAANDPTQQRIDGYDPDHYMDMALTPPGQDVSNLTSRRSYCALFITKHVNKLINLGVLKDHQSAGVTIALKNLSHGLVNNVARSHSTPTLNACGAFIPAVVSLPVIRNKAVLHICDGIRGVYHGGPFARPQFVWEHKTMYFATDPVAMDRIGWDAIDAQRVAVGKKPLAEDLPDPPNTTFIRRQPEHVEIAGALGLGEYDRKKIDLRRIQL